jgi:DNA-binding transcriptional LysR family regulator
MVRTLPPLNALRAFEAAARHLSFTRAAEELRVTQAAVSHQVKALEERLGVALFRRLTRGLRLTDEGQALLPDLRDGFDRLAHAVERVGRRGAQGRLTVSLLTTFALSWLVPRLPRFNERHPEIEVSLLATQRLADFVREEVDCAVRYGHGPWPGLRAEKLFDDELTPLCGKQWLPKLKEPGDLARVPLLVLSNDHKDWQTWLEAAGVPHIDGRKGTQFDSTRISVDAAIAGAGVAIGNPYVHEEPITEGRLFQPFDLVVPNGDSYWLVYPEAVAERPKLKAFRAWLLEEAKEAAAASTRSNVTPIATRAGRRRSAR